MKKTRKEYAARVNAAATAREAAWRAYTAAGCYGATLASAYHLADKELRLAKRALNAAKRKAGIRLAFVGTGQWVVEAHQAASGWVEVTAPASLAVARGYFDQLWLDA